jgi:hypothetical protein
VIPIVSTGGATLDIAQLIGESPPDLTDEFDYVARFHRHLGVSVKEERFRSPEEQPASENERFCRFR